MKLLSESTEMRMVRTIASSRDRMLAGFAYSSVMPDDFYYPPAKNAFERINTIAKAQSETPSWLDITHDSRLSERTRKILQDYDGDPFSSKDRIKEASRVLSEYRAIRSLYFEAEDRIEKLKSDKFDIEEILNDASEAIAKARSRSNQSELFYHLGAGSNVKDLVEKLLNGEMPPLIPTGFKAFDRVNHGIARGSLMMIAATTGGGKSTMGLELSRNMARWGAKVFTASLEMSASELIARRLANLSNIPLTDFLNPKKSLTDDSARYALKQLAKYESDLKEKGSGAVETLFSPEEDVSLEELLFMIRPYGYDVVIIDYINLLRGMSDEDQWRRLGNGARFAKRWALQNNAIVIMLAQLSDEGVVRYSRALQEHANNMWAWVYNDKAREGHIIEVRQLKARNQRAFTFMLQEDFEKMQLRDIDEEALKRSKDEEKRAEKEDRKRHDRHDKEDRSRRKDRMTVNDRRSSRDKQDLDRYVIEL